MRFSWIFCVKRDFGFCLQEWIFFWQKTYALCKKSAERKIGLSPRYLLQIKKDEINPVLFYLPEMRFERMTYRLEGGCSIQLSYSGLDPEGLDKRLVLWGTCIIPHKIYVITKIFDCKMFYYFCLRYNLYRLVNRGIKDYANRKSN